MPAKKGPRPTTLVAHEILRRMRCGKAIPAGAVYSPWPRIAHLECAAKHRERMATRAGQKGRVAKRGSQAGAVNISRTGGRVVRDSNTHS